MRSGRRELLDDDWDSVAAPSSWPRAFAPEALAGTRGLLARRGHLPLRSRAGVERSSAGPVIPAATATGRASGSSPSAPRTAPIGWARPSSTILKRDGRVLTVAGLDAVDGTPVLDIKPVMAEFLPRTSVRQPAWSHELMREYWKA